ncbi:NifX-associated nitrogen fixation protein [Candidatus Methylospira mobilis]|uniref:NifX-associated nitrogen fixation protein n=1 Tax=Candidatus Methylospira mobilis TaxID=1808979 RepID=A0A5Q0BIF3_9GAMM|nr:NifX-associated nitrogen fixation protein [Candidatus Methylospira mobilis]QFY41981.1 NifX-associated nitrogen fixation protein [Candidatus Methylospira mobilis]WNV02970.1 NifX-associated nitrogen fixation protein [Candidatus Methylospira mobilis]
MTEAGLVIEETDETLQSDISKEILKQLKAVDSYGTYDGWSDAKILDPLILTKERKRAIPIIGDPDEITMSRVKSYYNALASLIEKESGLMAVPVINLSHEGFGRAFVTVGRLIVLDKTLRDVHRFGFPSLAKLNEEAVTLINRAVELIKTYPEVANL